MNPRFSHQRNRALAKMEVVVIVAVLAVLATLFLPALPATKRKSSRLNSTINCISKVKIIGLADGSAQPVTTLGPQKMLQQTGVATNRLVLP